MPATSTCASDLLISSAASVHTAVVSFGAPLSRGSDLSPLSSCAPVSSTSSRRLLTLLMDGLLPHEKLDAAGNDVRRDGERRVRRLAALEGDRGAGGIDVRGDLQRTLRPEPACEP